MKTLLRNLFARLLSYTSIVGLGLGAFVWNSVARHGWGEGSALLALLSVALLLIHDRELIRFLATLWQTLRQPPSAPLILAAGAVALLGSGCRTLPQRCAELYPALEVVRRDTVLIRPEVRTDTLTRVLRQRDTLRIDTGRVRVLLMRQRDTLRIVASCAADTIRLPGAIVDRLRTVVLPAPWHERWWAGVLYTLAGLLLAAAVIILLLRLLGWFDQRGAGLANRAADVLDRHL